MHDDIARRDARSLCGNCERRFAILRRGPDLDLVAAHVRGGVLRFHGGMRQERHFVFGLDAVVDLRERRGKVTIAAPDSGLLGEEAGAQILPEALGGDLLVLSFLPGDFERRERLFCPPPVVGNDRHRTLEAHQLAHARHPGKPGIIHRLQLTSQNRTLNQRGVQHVRQADVDAVDRRTAHLVERVQPFARGADEPPFAGVLEPDVMRWGHARGSLGHLAEAEYASARQVRDGAALGSALRGGHVPPGGGGGDQHLARGRAGKAQCLLGAAHGSAAAG